VGIAVEKEILIVSGLEYFKSSKTEELFTRKSSRALTILGLVVKF